jgi:hypothetical protein
MRSCDYGRFAYKVLLVETEGGMGEKGKELVKTTHNIIPRGTSILQPGYLTYWTHIEKRWHD